MRQSDIAPVVKRLFSTRDGQAVLDYLQRRFNGQIKDETMARQVGQRDVILLINRMVEGHDV